MGAASATPFGREPVMLPVRTLLATVGVATVAALTSCAVIAPRTDGRSQAPGPAATAPGPAATAPGTRTAPAPSGESTADAVARRAGAQPTAQPAQRAQRAKPRRPATPGRLARPATSAITPHPIPHPSPRPNPPTHENGRPIAYLTFDDGPDPQWTPTVLTLLWAYRATATFFVIGENAAAHPELVARERGSGHAIGNHTYTHPWLTRLSSTAVNSELASTDALLGRTRCMRPPGGFVDARVTALATRAGKSVEMWDVDTSDWRRPAAVRIAARTTRGLHPGVVVLMHDGGGDRSRTVAALPEILAAITAQGYVTRALPSCR